MLVGSPRIELGCSALQAGAMTTLAHFPFDLLFFGARNWNRTNLGRQSSALRGIRPTTNHPSYVHNRSFKLTYQLYQIHTYKSRKKLVAGHSVAPVIAKVMSLGRDLCLPYPHKFYWYGMRESNPRQVPCKSTTLPLS